MARKFSELMAKMDPVRLDRVEARVKAALAEMPLQELRQAREFTQVQLAEILETSQSEISKIERRTDLYVSTLRNYIEAMGGQLELTARFPDGSIHIKQFHDLEEASKQTPN
jgi:transcriptional regulator with XRE-family HTH domain